MEKSVIIIFICFCSSLLRGQDSLCVFSINGSAYTKITNTIKPVKKGSFINSESTLVVDPSAKITAINSNGNAFKIQEEGNFSFAQILKFKVSNTKDITAKYFKLIWDEFMNNETNKTEIGGVFRGKTLMNFPINKSKMAGSKITFQWDVDNNIESYYIFLRKKDSDNILKFSTTGHTFTIYSNEMILKQNEKYEWMVSTTEFPNLKNVQFHSFKFISRKAYQKLRTNYITLIKDLKALGFNDAEITDGVCKVYGLCKSK